jgi:ATP-binding cassette subfamily B protein
MRASLATALVQETDILILDEPTNALDVETELQIINTLRNASRRCTIFIIGHRLSTMRYADTILVLHNGTVVENGAHEELMDAGGYYANIYRRQKLPRLTNSLATL